MDTPRSARLRQSVSKKSYKESPIDSPDLRKSVKESEKEKSESPDENKDTNTPKANKKGRGRPRKSVIDLTESPEEIKETAKTPKSRRKSTRDISPEISPKKLRTARTPSTQALENIVLENSPSLQKLESSPIGRPKRERKSVARYSDINLKINLKDNTVKPVKERQAVAPTAIDSSEEEEEYIDTELVEKPTTLFDDDEDVEGQRLYSFKTPKKKDSMAQLAQHTPKTPHRGTPKTPKSNRISQIQRTPTSRPMAAEFAKTPKHVRAAIKKSN